MRGLNGDGEASGGVDDCAGVGGVEFVDALGFFSSMDNPRSLKNNFRSLRLHAIKDLSRLVYTGPVNRIQSEGVSSSRAIVTGSGLVMFTRLYSQFS